MNNQLACAIIKSKENKWNMNVAETQAIYCNKIIIVL